MKSSSVNPRRRHNKHLTYFKLEKALTASGCPVCALIRANADAFFDSFLYEKVNDVGLRARFNADSGICNRHAYKLLGSHDGLAIAVMYRPLLERVVEALTARSELPINRGACLFCDGERDAEMRYASVLAEFLEDDGLEKSFSASSGVCLTHFELVRRIAGTLPSWFVSFHAAKFEKLLDGIRNYIDSANWSLGEKRPALSPEEERVWTEIPALFTGYEGMLARPKGKKKA